MAIKRDYKKSQLNQNFVAKNTKFRFRCTECGECCRNVEKEDKILLSAVDIYRAAKYLNLEAPPPCVSESASKEPSFAICESILQFNAVII